MDKPPDRSTSRVASLPLVGGVLALDFCNTASGRGTTENREHLRTVDDVLTWAHHAGIFDESRFVRLSALCSADHALGQRLLGRALILREAFYRLDASFVDGRTIDQSDLDTLAGIHAASLAKGRLTTRDNSFGWTWDVEDAPEEAVLGPIAASAMAVVTEADRARLKQCHGHHCGWLFLDTTKSNNRRWCEMEVCGNRAKQKRRRVSRSPQE